MQNCKLEHRLTEYIWFGLRPHPNSSLRSELPIYSKRYVQFENLPLGKGDRKFMKLLPERLGHYRVHWLGQGRPLGGSGGMNLRPCELPSPLEEIETNIRAVTEEILKLETEEL